MHIGIDFDNTIVCYDGLFHKVAREWELIPDRLPVNKLAVRDTLRAAGLEDRWTEMQGHVYGARMDEAEAFPGAIEFIDRMIRADCQISIISHKTRRPFLGPPHDLHAAAQAWIDGHLVPRLPANTASLNVFFELTKDAKLARITDCKCDAFIDDLPEILSAPGFPAHTRRLLFDPEVQHGALPGYEHFASWTQIADCFGQQ